MVRHLSEKSLRDSGISLDEALLILTLYKCGGNLEGLITQLTEKHWIAKDLMGYSIHQGIFNEIEKATLVRDPDVPTEDKLVSLATKMMDIYPQGKKPNTNYYWRGNKREILLKLQKFIKLYGQVSDEEILDATKRYVESFNGNYDYMRLLKYFILKTDKLGEEGITQISELASFLENKGQESEQNTDWTTNLV